MSEDKKKAGRISPPKAVRPAKAESVPSPEKLKLLVLIVNKRKAEFYTDFLQEFEVNLQLAVAAQGTASQEKLSLLGLVEEDKEVILATVREGLAPRVLSRLNEKFKSIRGGKGIAFTIPYSSVAGLSIYRFLSNKRTNYGG